MKSILASGRAAAIAAGLAFALSTAVAAPALAHGGPGGWHGHLPFAGLTRAVFVQTDNTAGNAIAVYDRSASGTLTAAGTYWTGGVGGILDGSAVDHTASQGSLVLDRGQGLLYAVNAGSNTISVFSVFGDQLALRQVISSGGTFPVSIAVHGDLLYVLNARSGGSVQGYVRAGDRLVEVPWWNRNLGLDQSFTGTVNEFTHTPGQVGFTPDGSHLIVTTKANGNDVDVFDVASNGNLSATPVVNSEGSTPFSFSFDGAGNLVLVETGTGTVQTLTVGQNGVLTAIGTPALTGESATCWVEAAGPDLFYTSNAGSATVTGINDDGHGNLTALANTGTDPGTVDAAATPSGRFLYVQTGANGIVDEFAVGAGGLLSPLGSVTVPNAAGGEGIATG
ncbi:MAG: lactonase family protein [Solirubrobacteraceae bacterium]